jgi:hypothetical protein
MTLRILDVEEQGDLFVVRRADAEGHEIFPHVFPKDALEWRAAEYEIDPGDVDTLLGIILYEPFLDGHSHEHPKHLFNAASVKEAREYHTDRIAQARKAHPLEDPDGHLEKIRRGHLMHPEALGLKRADVVRGRAQRAAERAAKAADPDGERLVRLRASLGSPERPAATLRDPEAGLPADTNAYLRKAR